MRVIIYTFNVVERNISSFDIYFDSIIYEKENHKTVRYIADDEILGIENVYVLPTIKYLASKIFQCPKSTTVSNGYAIMCKTAFEKVDLS